MSFPPGLDLCPNDGVRLLAGEPREPTHGTGAPIDPTESLALGSQGGSSPEPTASIAEEIHPSDLTRAERPSARVRRSQIRDSASARRRRHPTRRPEERIGAVLGNYKILEMLGRGGMGCVYLAEHIKLGRRVALKLLREDHAQRRDAVARFFQEARSVNRIRHRNIVDVTDFVELDDGTTFLVMELLDGDSLGRLLRKTGLAGPRALALLIQMCDGLDAAHEMGIVHRDLKPDNIFVVPTRDGAELIKLLDFGVAKLLWRDEDDDFGVETAAGAVVGTPTYMSPEQAGGMEIDARSDIYSLGAIMYEMFTGQPLFRGKSFGEFVRKHLSEDPVPPSRTDGGRHIDERLEAVIMRCLEKAPSRRYQHIRELREDLMTLLGAVETSLPVSTAQLAHSSLGSRVPPSALAAPRIGTATPATTAMTGSGELLHSDDIMPFTPTPSGVRATASGRSSMSTALPMDAASVPETAMSMGDLPAVRSDVHARGLTPLWIIGGAVVIAGAALAVLLATRGSTDEPTETVSAARPSAGPVVTPMEDDRPASPQTDRRFTVRFLSDPAADVFELTSGDRMCTTPCDVTVDPESPGPSSHRDYELRRGGYYSRPVRIDLAHRRRTVNVALTRERRGSSRPNRANEPTPPTPGETEVADGPDSPVVQPDPEDPPKRTPPTGPIDPTETLDPFANP